MTFVVPGSWVWDFWTVFDADAACHHLFFLHAPVALRNPDLRHRNARAGHATSPDLRTWTRHRDPLPHPREGLDDLATWTGCTVRGDDGWWLFTTGLSHADDGRVQRVGSARSEDLETWERTPLLLSADAEHYQQTCAAWPEEAWRDPWVVREDGGPWHMYLTARDAAGLPGCGVVGHAVSEDLQHWEVRPPLSEPTGRFEWLEVISVVQVEGRWVLLFSCLAEHMPDAPVEGGGVWSVPVEGPGSAVDVRAAVRLSDEHLYVGKVVHHEGAAYLMAFRNRDDEGRFVGGVIDPVPVTWREDGAGLVVTRPRAEPG